MPMNPIIEDPDFNGVRYSRNSCSLRWDAFLVNGWKSFTPKASYKKGKTWGNKAGPAGRTRGKYDPSAECEIYLEYFNNLKNFLAAKGAALGKSWMEVSSFVTFTAFEPERGSTIVEVVGVQVSDYDMPSSDSSDDQLSVKLSLDVMRNVIDGVPDVIDLPAF